ncbi:4031_t:CDS:1, partial [Gigaspora margarita]
MQTFLSSPRYNKKYIFKNPTSLYENFCNAYVYHLATSTGNPCPNAQTAFANAQNEWKQVRQKKKEIIEQIINDYFATSIRPPLYTSFSSTSSTTQTEINDISNRQNIPQLTIITSEEPRFNAAAQKRSFAEQNIAEKKLDELNALYNIAQDPQIRHDLLSQITETRDK